MQGCISNSTTDNRNSDVATLLDDRIYYTAVL